MAITRDPESRIEKYREHLKSCLEDTLERIDEIMDYCYTDRVKSIDIKIHIDADSEIPTIEYTTQSIVNPYRQERKL